MDGQLKGTGEGYEKEGDKEIEGKKRMKEGRKA